MATVNERLAEYEDIFRYLDTNQSGYLDVNELERGLMLLGNNPTPGEVEAIIKSLNENYVDENEEEKTARDSARQDSQREKSPTSGRQDTQRVKTPGSARQDTQRGKTPAETTDRSKKINFDQFHALMEHHRKSQEEEYEDLKIAFQSFDKNGDGKIDRQELKEALLNSGERRLTEEEVNKLFDEADEDNNNFISFTELINIIMR